MRAPLRAACPMELHDVARALELAPVGLPEATITGVATDSRDVQPGDLFVARVGEQADGHRYLDAALGAGAAALLVERLPEQAPAVPVLQVSDTTVALGQLARFHRRRLGLPLVAVTGSNGKTTTKEMIAAILAAEAGGRERVLVTPGNFNNHVGLPLTLLAGEAHHRLGVVELGMNAPGEIDILTGLAEPEVGVVTNASEAHLARFGTVDRVARAKAELWARLADTACAVVPLDDPRLPALAASFSGRQVTFGETAGADVRILRVTPRAEAGLTVELRLAGTPLSVTVPVPGRHNAWNAAAATAAAHALGLAPTVIAQGLPQTRLPGHRAVRLELGGVLVLDDSYNANPASVRAALGTLADLPGEGRLGAVLGDLRELGEAGEDLHRALGVELGQRRLSVVVGVGTLAAALCDGARAAGVPEVVHVADAEAAVAVARSRFHAGDRVLVKGSRAVGLERMLHAWQQALHEEVA